MSPVHAKNPHSVIAKSSATKSASVDIPSRYGNKQALSTGATRAGNNLHPTLLTPPNSISPTLPPQNPSGNLRRTHGSVDSDVDLQEAVDHAKCQDQPSISHPLSRAALSDFESAAVITPTMLARHPLPDILLANGPMAIRHVLSYLAQSVPGFSRIPPAKARRLVVAAFESRTGGGHDGEVEFEKVGWGKWEAKVRGRPSHRIRGMPAGSLHDGHLSPPASTPGALSVSSVGVQAQGRRPSLCSPSSYADETTKVNYDNSMQNQMNMAEYEADKMSLDGDVESYPSSAPLEESIHEDDSGDVTDEEDWAGIGADELRQRAYAASGGLSRQNRNYNHLSLQASNDRLKNEKRLTTLPYRPLAKHQSTNHDYHNHTSNESPLSSLNVNCPRPLETLAQSPQERAAIEALLSMGSS